MTAARVQLPELWRAVGTGELEVISSSLSDNSAIVAICPGRPGPRPDYRPQFAFLRHALMCGSITAAAIDLNVSPSTASLRMAVALRRMGAAARGSKVPLPIALFVHAVSCSRPHRAFAWQDPSEPGRHLVHFPRSDLAFREALSPREWEAMALLIEGLSHRQIADTQRTATRTVANQLGSVFRKLGVSGRLDLLRAIACSEHDGPLARAELEAGFRSGLQSVGRTGTSLYGETIGGAGHSG